MIAINSLARQKEVAQGDEEKTVVDRAQELGAIIIMEIEIRVLYFNIAR